ncbi:hypothetical protein MSG28_013949 [Choristoneura fumiferana]|uniref:Uncharacterized protein n=1 Tax=Choristoneura fumiferana TaxID=7141 RepID=A0ACC0K9L1_CHOFU|nr:hypothetical protein MSG28_013949 [Choristoneura fumiferana]
MFIISVLLLYASGVSAKNIDSTGKPLTTEADFDNNIIDFESEYIANTNKKYGTAPWHDDYNKETNRYTIVNEYNAGHNKTKDEKNNDNQVTTEDSVATTSSELDVIPLELISTTQNYLVSIIESTTEEDLTVIPLATTERVTPIVEIDQPVTLPSTKSPESTNDYYTTESPEDDLKVNGSETNTTINIKLTSEIKEVVTTSNPVLHNTTLEEVLTTNSSKQIDIINRSDEITDKDDPKFVEPDSDDEEEVPEDYYDTKDVIPTKAPSTDVVSVFFGLAGSVVESVVESVAERVVPKGIFDLFKRMQKQNEALEAERLRSREENGGLGQFGRGILKSISSGLSGQLSQLMAGAKDIGSLDNDRGFVGSVAAGVSNVANVANSLVDQFKIQVQAIYPELHGDKSNGDFSTGEARRELKGRARISFCPHRVWAQSLSLSWHGLCTHSRAPAASRRGLRHTNFNSRLASPVENNLNLRLSAFLLYVRTYTGAHINDKAV